VELWDEPVLYRGEDESRYYSQWQLVRVELDRRAGSVVIRGVRSGQILTAIPVNDIQSCKIDDATESPSRRASRSGPHYLAHLVAPELAPWSGNQLDAVNVGDIGHGVIRLTRLTGDRPGEGWETFLRSTRRGQRGQSETVEMVRRLTSFLRVTGGSQGLCYQTTAHGLTRGPGLPVNLEPPETEPTGQLGVQGVADEPSDEARPAVSPKHKRAKGAYFLGGILASVVGYAAGLLAGQDLPSAEALTEATCCCELPVFALSLLFLWLIIPKEGKVEKWGGTAVAICAIANFAVGYLLASI
jgi:hypothetical protein